MARKLTLERDQVIHSLDNKKPTKSFSSMKMALKLLGKVLMLRDGERFTLETGVRDAIAYDGSDGNAHEFWTKLVKTRLAVTMGNR